MKNMKKKTKFLLIGLSFLTFLTLFIGISKFTKASAATIGQTLTSPETGWKRYQDSDSKISYTNLVSNANASWNGGTSMITQVGSDVQWSFKFRFSGTKLRLLGAIAPNRPNKVNIKIDGVQQPQFTCYGSSLIYTALLYEKNGLTPGVHQVEVYREPTAYYEFDIDAIDIDSTGYLIDPLDVVCTGLTLNKTTLEMQIGQTDSLIATVVPSDATNKTIKWVSNNPQVATVDENTGLVTSVTPGIAIITASTTDGTYLSASCTVTVTNPGRAILEITMSNGERKEFDLAISEVNKFVDWYNGNTSPSYKINVTTNIKPFTSRSEYLAHDKISSFEVKEYTSN